MITVLTLRIFAFRLFFVGTVKTHKSTAKNITQTNYRALSQVRNGLDFFFLRNIFCSVVDLWNSRIPMYHQLGFLLCSFVVAERQK